MTKEEARLFAKSRRNKIEPEEIEFLQSEIEKFFLSMDLPCFQYLQSYMPLLKLKEVDPGGIVNLVKQQYPQIIISIPQILENGNMESIEINSTTKLEKNKFGIFEAVEGIKVDPQKLDIVLIPLLAFDTYGNRVGYGKGYFDRFLKTCRSNIIKIGLSFWGPVDRISDVNQLDIPLDYCITPKMIYAFH